MLNGKNKFQNAETAQANTFGFYSTSTNSTVFQVLFWIMVGIDIIFLILCLFLCDRIRISIKIIKIVSEVFAKVPTLFIFPIFTYIFLVIWWIYVVGVAIVIFGAGKPVQVEKSDPALTDYQYKMIDYKYDKILQGISIYHFFGFLWVSGFISAFSELTLAGAFAAFYFTRPGSEGKKHLIWSSFKRAIRYHLGSIAFGSLLVAICQFFQVILAYIEEKTKGSVSTLVKFIVKCLKCCFWCLEKFLKFMNRNAYILISIHGTSFLKSAKDAFFLILRNIVRVAVTNWVGSWTLFLGRVTVSCITTGLALVIFQKYVAGVTFYIVPTVLVCIMSFIISGVFNGVYDLGIDSVFLCYMEDCERNDGSPGREMYASADVQKKLTSDPNEEEEEETEDE